MGGGVPFLVRQAPALGKTPPFDVAEPRIATLHMAFRIDRGAGRMITVRKLGGFGSGECLYLTDGAMFPEIRGFVGACFADVEDLIFCWSRFRGNFTVIEFVRNRAGVTPAYRISHNFGD